MCVLRLRSLAEENKSPRRYGWGLRSRASSPRLRGAWFFGRGGFLDLALYIGNAGVGADPNLVVGGLESLFAFSLGAASAQNGAKVASQEAQRYGDQGWALER